MSHDLQIVPLSRCPADIHRFLKLAYPIYAGDPNWVAPLLMDVKKVFADANPLFHHAEVQLWVARRDGRDVGRIAGILDRNYVEYQQDNAAFFGFFECVDDRAVSAALFAAVAAWAKQQGAARLLGPMNPTTNDECGLLINAFDRPPVFMMTYNPPYYAGLIEAAGFTKSKDLLAFFFDLSNTPMSRFERLAEKFKKREPDIAIVPLRKKTLEAQLAQVKQVYNQAWERNWGFVPMTDAEMNFMAERLKPLLVEGLAYVAQTPQEPVGFLLAAPDFNQAFQPLKGRLLSPGIVRALPMLLGWRTPDICRVITLGVTAKYRGRGIEAAMLADGLRTGFRLGFKHVEASWILEDNEPVKRVIGLFGGEPYKTYRVFEQNLATG